MKQQVELTWCLNGRYKKELCYLLDDDTPVFDAEGDLMTEFQVEEHRKDGYVLFEDQDGQFWLPATSIHALTVM